MGTLSTTANLRSQGPAIGSEVDDAIAPILSHQHSMRLRMHGEALQSYEGPQTALRVVSPIRYIQSALCQRRSAVRVKRRIDFDDSNKRFPVLKNSNAKNIFIYIRFSGMKPVMTGDMKPLAGVYAPWPLYPARRSPR